VDEGIQAMGSFIIISSVPKMTAIKKFAVRFPELYEYCSWGKNKRCI
jgi:hypothetical protein